MGPIAWDLPYRVPRVPVSGAFVQGECLGGRPGGTGANIARALASREVNASIVGYVGKDAYGQDSITDLRERGVDCSHVSTWEGETSLVMLLIEPSGERTIIGLVPDYLNRVEVPVNAVAVGDVVYFAAWRDEFAPAAIELAARGCWLGSVPFARPAASVPINYIIGSMSEVAPAAADDPWGAYEEWTLGALRFMTLTAGRDGAMLVDRRGVRHFAATTVTAVDATGAGDAFSAAVLASIMTHRPVRSGVIEGIAWGAATVATHGSIPPDWAEVQPTVTGARARE